MSLCYRMNCELNMILYIGRGLLRPDDFFALEKTALPGDQRQPGLITLVDALDVSTCFEREDIHHFIDNIHGLIKNGREPGPYVMLTNDWGIHLLAQAVTLMSSKIDLKIRIYTTLEEAITELGLSDHKQEIIQLWNECNLESSETSGRLQK